MSLSLKRNKYYKIIKEKMREVIHNLKNTKLAINNASMFYNMYLIKKVYLGAGIMSILEQ